MDVARKSLEVEPQLRLLQWILSWSEWCPIGNGAAAGSVQVHGSQDAAALPTANAHCCVPEKILQSQRDLKFLCLWGAPLETPVQGWKRFLLAAP